jgi:hypothetical protein
MTGMRLLERGLTWINDASSDFRHCVEKREPFLIANYEEFFRERQDTRYAV